MLDYPDARVLICSTIHIAALAAENKSDGSFIPETSSSIRDFADFVRSPAARVPIPLSIAVSP